jgi:hypothetical protein
MMWKDVPWVKTPGVGGNLEGSLEAELTTKSGLALILNHWADGDLWVALYTRDKPYRGDETYTPVKGCKHHRLGPLEAQCLLNAYLER